MIRWLSSMTISTLAVPVTLFKVITSHHHKHFLHLHVDEEDRSKAITVHERELFSHPIAEIDSSSSSSGGQPLSSELVTDTLVNAERALIKQPGAYVNLKHGTCHYILQGPEDGKLVLMLHGISVYSFIWLKLAKELNSEGYRVLMFDFYGHGYSAVPDVEYNSHLYREQVEDLLTTLNLWEQHSSALVVGHSMGGLVASEFTATHKDWVEKMILFNSAGLPVKISKQHPLPFALWQLVRLFRSTKLFDFLAPTLAGIISFAASRTTVTYESICDTAHYLDEELKAEGTWIKNLIKNATQHVIDDGTLRFAKAINFLSQCWMHQMAINADRAKVLLSIVRNFPLLDADHSTTLKNIQEHIPVLIIWGVDDGILPHSLVEDFKTHLPHAEVLSIPHSDHAVFLQKPALVFQSIKKFVESTLIAS